MHSVAGSRKRQSETGYLLLIYCFFFLILKFKRKQQRKFSFNVKDIFFKKPRSVCGCTALLPNHWVATASSVDASLGLDSMANASDKFHALTLLVSIF